MRVARHPVLARTFRAPRLRAVRPSLLRELAGSLSIFERDQVVRSLHAIQPPIEALAAFVAIPQPTWSIWVKRPEWARARARLDGQRVRPHQWAYVPGTRVLLLSRPTKMPGLSWALPAGPACPYMVLGPNSICGSCYAMTGRYQAVDHRNAMQTRFDWTRQCMRTPEGRAEFVSVMAAAINGAGYRYMRVHDSGDLFSEAYTRSWIAICQALPQIHFWFPTRSWQAHNPWLQAIVDLNALPNVTVRPSALYFGDSPPVVPGLAAGTTVLDRGWSCLAPQQNNACRSCRTCWDKGDREVAYHTNYQARMRRPGDEPQGGVSHELRASIAVSLIRARCEVHGTVKVHNDLIHTEHGCGRACIRIERASVAPQGPNESLEAYLERLRRADAGEPAAAEPAQEAESSMLERISIAATEASREWRVATMRMVAELEQQIEACKAHIAVDQTAVEDARAHIEQDTERMRSLMVAVLPLKRTLDRFDLRIESRVTPAPASVRSTDPRPWSRMYGACQGCGTTGRAGSDRHAARGLCYRCNGKRIHGVPLQLEREAMSA